MNIKHPGNPGPSAIKGALTGSLKYTGRVNPNNPTEALIDLRKNPMLNDIESMSDAPAGVQAPVGQVGHTSVNNGQFASAAPPVGGLGAGGAGGARKTSPAERKAALANALKPLDNAINSALVKKAMDERDRGEKSIRKDGSIDQDKLDERTKQELNKLIKDFKNSTKDLRDEIEKFQTDNKDELEKDKELNGLLDGVKNSAEKGDSIGFRKAAKALDDYIKDDENKAVVDKYGKDLTDLNDRIQAKANGEAKENAEKQTALARNNPHTMLKASDKFSEEAKKSSEDVSKLLDERYDSLSDEDKQKVDDFKESLGKTIDSTNPEGDEIYDPAKVKENLAELGKAHQELPPEIQEAIKEPFSRAQAYTGRARELQELGRSDVESTEEYKGKVEELAPKLTETVKAHDGEEKLEEFFIPDLLNKDDVDEARQRSSETESSLDPSPEAREGSDSNSDTLGVDFGDDDSEVDESSEVEDLTEDFEAELEELEDEEVIDDEE